MGLLSTSSFGSSLVDFSANVKKWGSLVHLSFNMWEEHDRYKKSDNLNYTIRYFSDKLTFDDTVWNDVLKHMKDCGLNMVVIDLGDGIKYDSHPEISVKNAWSTSRLRKELDKIRSYGITPIPKLNFSSTHDAWLGKYSRMVSTDIYYKVCKEIIAEVVQLFDVPSLFHLGFDEETAAHQRSQDFIVVRQNDLWWKDFYVIVDQVEKCGSRAWIWSDYAWNHSDVFFKKMSKEIVQSNWYYQDKFDDLNKVELATYIKLAKAGYYQIPCASYYQDNSYQYQSEKGIGLTVDFCKEHLWNDRLLGFLQTNWRPTMPKYKSDIIKSIDLMAKAKLKLADF